MCNSLRNEMPSQQARYWILTIPRDDWSVPTNLPAGVTYICGQPEIGASGYRHWQLVVYFAKKVTLSRIKITFGQSAHAEPTRSTHAKSYVWKDDTRDGERFEQGTPSIERNNSNDWDGILLSAQQSKFDEIPSDVLLRYYGSITRIASDYATPTFLERSCVVYYGPTGTGKSHLAWEEAGPTAYPKDPRSKFWYGYKGQKTVIIDEFRGGIDIAHLLRWLDRYPCLVELKGSSRTLNAENLWITSNLHPREWYPELDSSTCDALLRRLVITHMPLRFYSENPE